MNYSLYLCEDMIEFENVFLNSWCSCYKQCYNTKFGRDIWENKYRDSRALFAMLIIRQNKLERVIASYSGIILNYQEELIFLSTDTMSDGTVRGATVKMANYLYQYLKSINVRAVLGFPNKNIFHIREKYLDWRQLCSFQLYLKFSSSLEKSLLFEPWHICRPDGLYFKPPIRPFNLLGLEKKFVFPSYLYASSKKINGLDINLTKVLGKDFKLCGKELLPSGDLWDSLRYDCENLPILSWNSIDVP